MMKTIELTKGMVAMVDDEDFDYLSQWKWHVSLSKYGGSYAKRAEWINGKLKKFSMHGALLCVPEGHCIDHIDGDGLNNQKSNLRLANQMQNCANGIKRCVSLSGFKGVSQNPNTKKWVARIGHNWNRKHIGTFDNPRDAALAYDIAAIQMNGEFARTNASLGLLNT